jgi:hypothetical protein
LISIDIINISIRIDLLVFIIENHIDEEDIRKIIDPMACARKYLIIASDS